MKTSNILGILLLSHMSYALVGYDCSHQNVNITSFSLVDYKTCDPTYEQPNTSTVKIQLIQIKRTLPVFTRTCLIEVTRIVSRCGWISHSKPVEKGFGSYILETSPESCNSAHRDRVFSINSNILISDLKVNRTNIRMVTLAGKLSTDGSCTGQSYSDSYGSWDDVVVQGTISISLMQHLSYYDISSGKVITPHGTRCDFNSDSCWDANLGQVFWNSDIYSMCREDEYDVLYTGPSTLTEKQHTSTGELIPQIYTVEHGNVIFALAIKGKTRFCYQEALLTEHPKLLILEDQGSGFIRPTNVVDLMNTDLFTYINAKFVYLNRHIQHQMNSLYRTIVKQECQLAEENLKQKMVLARIAPLEFAYLHGGGPGYSAILGGEVIYLIKCVPVPVTVQSSSVCYQDIPIQYNNKSMFLTAKNRILASTSTEVACSEILPNMFKLDTSWYSLHPTPRVTPTPQQLSPIAPTHWTYISPTELATTGIYNQDALDAIRDHIMYPINLPSIKNTIARAISHESFDSQRLSFDNLASPSLVETISRSITNRLWGWFTFVGSFTSGAIGIIFMWKILKFILDSALNFLALRDTFGLTWRLLISCCDGATYYLINRYHLNTPENKTEHSAEQRQDDVQPINVVLNPPSPSTGRVRHHPSFIPDM